MQFTQTGRKQLAAIFIGASLLAGCAPQEKLRQDAIRDDVYQRLNAMTEARKPYLTREEYQQQKSRDECSADHIATDQNTVEDFMDNKLPAMLPPEGKEALVQKVKSQLDGIMSAQALRIVMSCNTGAPLPPPLELRAN